MSSWSKGAEEFGNVIADLSRRHQETRDYHDVVDTANKWAEYAHQLERRIEGFRQQLADKHKVVMFEKACAAGTKAQRDALIDAVQADDFQRAKILSTRDPDGKLTALRKPFDDAFNASVEEQAKELGS